MTPEWSGISLKTQKTAIVCLLSAVICALLGTFDCRIYEFPDISHDVDEVVKCHIMILSTVMWGDFDWQDWLHWVNWFPGIVFGFMFAFFHFDKKVSIFRYSILSGAIFFGAELIFYLFMISSEFFSGDSFPLLGIALLAGPAAGAFGSFALLITGNILAGASKDNPPGLRTILVGAVMGLVITLVGLYWLAYYRLVSQGIINQYLAWSFIFALWQIPVGVSLGKRIQQQTIENVVPV